MERFINQILDLWISEFEDSIDPTKSHLYDSKLLTSDLEEFNAFYDEVMRFANENDLTNSVDTDCLISDLACIQKGFNLYISESEN